MNTLEKQKFIQRQQLPLQAKIEMTKNRIKAWYEHWEKHDEENLIDLDCPVYEALSGGKDSQVLGHIIWSMGGKYRNIPMVFSNTGLEMPEIVKHVRQYLKKELGWNVIEIRPKKTYQQVWQEEGIPIVSKKVARQIRTLKAGPTGNGDTYKLYNEGITSKGYNAPNWKIPEKWRHLVDNPEIKTTEKCCDYLKKYPIRDFERESGLKGRGITGMMADEGGYRSGMTQCNVFEGKTTRSSPMLFWTEADIWEYIKTYEVKICEAYYGRVYNESGEMIACNAPYYDLPNIEDSFVLNLDISRCEGVDSGYLPDAGSWIEFVDNNAYEKPKYFYISGEKRTGCMFCAFGAHLEKGSNRFQRMSISHPRQHAIIMDRIGMRKPLELIGVKVTFDD